MVKLVPKKVNKQVGMNPIARAVARESMRRSIVDQKIQLYVTPEGESCVEFCVPMFTLFLALLATAEADPKVGLDNYEVKIIRGALSALDQMIADNSYRRINIVSLDTGLDCAQVLVSKINPVLFNQEWNKIAGGV